MHLFKKITSMHTKILDFDKTETFSGYFDTDWAQMFSHD